MPRRNPRIPYGAFGEGRLPPQLRRRLVRRADRSARRIYAPEIQALRSQRSGVRRAYRRDVQNAQGAINFTDQALSQVPLKGLTGRYKQELAGEIAQSRVDNREALPALTAEARATRSQALGDIRDSILTTRIEETQTAAKTLNSLLTEARADAESYLNSKKGKKAGRLTSTEGVKTAMLQANNTLAMLKKKPWEFDSPDDQERAWLIIEQEAAGEGATPIEAHRAVKLLRRRLARSAQKAIMASGIPDAWPWGR